MPFLSLGRAHFTSLNGMMPVSRSSESLPAEVRVGRKPIFAVSLLASSTTASRQGSISPHTFMAPSVLPQSPSSSIFFTVPEAMPVIIGD
jgi:hypothetical protein